MSRHKMRYLRRFLTWVVHERDVIEIQLFASGLCLHITNDWE